MPNSERERYEKLQSVKFRKFDILCRYEELGSLREVQDEAILDLQLIKKLYDNEPQTYAGIYNLLHNFVWFICYSDGNTEPASLVEDDIDGIRYYEMMQSIRNKYIQK